MLFVDEFCGILVYIKFGADVTSQYEYSVIIDSLNNLLNKLIADGRYTDAVDELIIKIAHAPIKKFKIKMTEV